MGNHHSDLTEDALEEYEALTFLSRKEIVHAWSVWKKLVADETPLEQHADLTARLYPSTVLKQLSEVKHNPFQEDIIRCFAYKSSSKSSSLGGGKYFSFDEFLDLLHVMSPKTPQDIKAHFAFKLYDVDGDHKLDRDDLDILICKLAGCEEDREHSGRGLKYLLSAQDRQDLIDKLMEENGIESSSGLSRQEFNFIIGKCPDFAQCFSFTL
ncbi:EF-hand domain pair [Trinorchestia longiramus]|nr:EF-hand domain pair [Trinorchestia longiramus]